MGDFGPGMYVPESLLPIYREVIVPLADICVPNQFEAELLTGCKIATQDDALGAMLKLHELGVGTVILSSTEFEGGDSSPLVALASNASEPGVAYRIEIPRLPAAFVGTGDLFTALCTAWLRRSDGQLSAALEKTIGTMQAVLRRTIEQAEADAAREGLSKPTPFQKELRLIQSKADIEDPTVVAKAVKISVKK